MRKVVPALVPVVLGMVCGAAWFMAGPRTRLQILVAPGLVVALTGVLLSAIWLGALLAARRVRAAQEQALAQAAVLKRAEHQQFLSRLDHEVKNPLTAIRAALAAHGTGGSEHLQIADRQSARLGELITDLRKLSDLATRDLEYESVDLFELVADAVDAFREQGEANGVDRRVDVQFPKAPWQIPPVPGDPDLLYLAVYNVLSNAAKFSSPGDPIEVRAGEDDGRVTLDIADTGIGMDPADTQVVWQELARGANARGTPGSGIGLALVKVVVERHGGQVSLRSRAAEGTVVRLSLPLRPLQTPPLTY